MERIQKILSQWGVASRRQAEKLITAGKVRVNGKIASLGDKLDLAVDVLEVNGKVIQLTDRPQPIYLLLNKPTSVVSTCSDPQNRPTVLDLLPNNLKKGKGIHPVGRLDFNSSGALLLTNDGDLTLNLTHPRYHLPKTYLVWLDKHPTEEDLVLWRNGINLNGKKTLPAEVEIVRRRGQQTLIKIVLIEGRNRQIRRTAEKLGYKVVELHRTAIGSISLNSRGKTELTNGSYRHLTSSEIALIKNFN
ncbi:pseudouridine synthase [Myxosarcina sp. GI1]|uniref:pseudouridine synthase n=1 Tax=Myxosarcina sp. GI1 TaxID=1541065 RepID=UPI00055BD39F|nr:pseudouridine synthase [Myxosarcina sp. GI1]